MNVEVIRPKLANYQKQILYALQRYTVTQAGTKIGKTFSHLWWLFEKAMKATKRGANYWWVAPVYSQAKIAFGRLKRVVERHPGFKCNESELFIATPVGSFIWFKSAEKPDNLYGEDVFAAVFDEFTRARETAWFALRTTLTATQAPCKFIGNAKGRKNWGYRLALKARSGDPDYAFFRITAYDAVAEGILSQKEVDQAKKDLPDAAFRELYLAEDLEDQANPFGIEFIKSATMNNLSLEPTVCYGIDLAKSIDWTVVTGIDQFGQVSEFHRWQSDWGQTRRRIIEIVGNLPAAIDSTGVGDPIAEDIQKECRQVESYHFSTSSKQKLMEGLAADLQNGRIFVLDGVMRDEMESFEYEYTRTGVRYNAPEGLHDDCVCSLALANYKRVKAPGRTFVTTHR